MQIEINPGKLAGPVQIPASKSMAHRLLICAGLAQGTSTITNISTSKDMEATIQCLKALGASVQRDNAHSTIVTITGCQPQKRKEATFACNESGSTLRFFIPLAALSNAWATFTGKGRLMERPLSVYADIFAQQGLKLDQQAGTITLQGPLQPGLFQIPGNISSQFVSGLLFACPLMNGTSEIAVLQNFESASYAHLSVQAMKEFGIHITQPSASGFIIAGNQTYQPGNHTVEGDWSQAAFFAVLGAVRQEITMTGLDRNSCQGDKVILDILQKAGANIAWNGEDLTIFPARLTASAIDLADCPDLGPVLFVMAAFCHGTTTFTHAGRLRLKESDRIACMEEELRKWGVDINSHNDTVTVTGKPESQYRLQDGVTVDAHNDHRIAMAMTIFALCAGKPCTIEGAKAVEKSWPDFFEQLHHLQQEART